jgi:hypothetical protein
MDVKEIISDIKGTFIERMRNPFILTYIISWVAWNWLLVFEVCNFPETYTLQNKIAIINNYIQEQIWCNLTFYPLWSAFVAANIYVWASGIFLLLFSFYQQTIKPKIYSFTAQDENIPRYLYNSLNKRHDNLKKDFDETKKLWNEIEEKKETLDGKIKTLETTNSRLTADLSTAEEKNTSAQARLKVLGERQEESVDTFMQIFVNNKFWYLTYTQKNKKDSISYTAMRFESDWNVRNEGNKIIYQIRDISITSDNQVIKFKLYDYNNRSNFKEHYLFNMGDGSFKGYELEINNKKEPIQYLPMQPDINSYNVY